MMRRDRSELYRNSKNCLLGWSITGVACVICYAIAIGIVFLVYYITLFEGLESGYLIITNQNLFWTFFAVGIIVDVLQVIAILFCGGMNAFGIIGSITGENPKRQNVMLIVFFVLSGVYFVFRILWFIGMLTGYIVSMAALGGSVATSITYIVVHVIILAITFAGVFGCIGCGVGMYVDNKNLPVPIEKELDGEQSQSVQPQQQQTTGAEIKQPQGVVYTVVTEGQQQQQMDGKQPEGVVYTIPQGQAMMNPQSLEPQLTYDYQQSGMTNEQQVVYGGEDGV